MSAKHDRLNGALSALAALYPDGGELLLATDPAALFLRAADELKRLRSQNATREIEQTLEWATRDVPEDNGKGS